MPAVNSHLECVNPYSEKEYAADDIFCGIRIELSEAPYELENLLHFENCFKSLGFISELSHIDHAIDKSNYILKLQDGWNEHDSIKISEIAYNNAIEFLKLYSNSLLELSGFIINAPSISPLDDGSIDLYWKNKTASLLINFHEEYKDIAFYYFKDNQTEPTYDSNGQIPISTIKDSFANWLKNFPSMEKDSSYTR